MSARYAPLRAILSLSRRRMPTARAPRSKRTPTSNEPSSLRTWLISGRRLRYVALLVAAARAGAASGGGVRLSVYPKGVRKELEEALPQEVQLKPHGHDAVLHVVKLDDEDMSMKLYAWALRPVYTNDYSGRSTPSGYPSSEEDEGGPSTAAAAASTGEEQDLVAEGVRRGLFQLTQPALLISEGWRKVPQVL